MAQETVSTICSEQPELLLERQKFFSFFFGGGGGGTFPKLMKNEPGKCKTFVAKCKPASSKLGLEDVSKVVRTADTSWACI